MNAASRFTLLVGLIVNTIACATPRGFIAPASAAAPIYGTEINRGSGRVYGPASLAGHTCVTTDLYYATSGVQGVTWFIDSTTTATLTLYRHDVAGIDHSQNSTPQTVTANVENVQSTLYPLRISRLNVCNTTGGSGTLTIDVDESL